MKKLLFWLAVAGLVPFVAWAQGAEDPAAERARISAERSQVEAAYRVQEKACYGKFAVNDCLTAARAQRREALADLKRQETSLNDADRKRKGAERQRALEEKAAAEKKQAKPGQPAQGGAPQHPVPQHPSAAQKEAERAQEQAANAASAQERKRQAQIKTEEKKAEQIRRADEAAKNAKRQQEQQAQAEEHRAAVNKRLAERTKPPAQPLPPAN